MFVKKLISVSAISLAIVGCGGDDDGGGGGVDADALAADLENPTGEIADGTGAKGVADAFGEVLNNQAGTGGERRSGVDCSGATSAEFSCTCSGGGSLDVSVSGSQSSYEANYDYNDCCIGSADCCYNGSGAVAGTTDKGAAFSQCGSFDVDIDCAGSSGSFKWDYCLDSQFRTWYRVEYMTDTYAVTGYYDSKTGGSWTVRDANGEWTCTAAADGTGSCTNGTETYTW